MIQIGRVGIVHEGQERTQREYCADYFCGHFVLGEEGSQHQGEGIGWYHKGPEVEDVDGVKAEEIESQIEWQDEERVVHHHVEEVAQSVGPVAQSEDHLVLSEALFPFGRVESDGLSDYGRADHPNVDFQQEGKNHRDYECGYVRGVFLGFETWMKALVLWAE